MLLYRQWRDAGRLPTYSGGTALDLHQLPFNPGTVRFTVHRSRFTVKIGALSLWTVNCEPRYRRGRMRILPVSGSVSIQTAQP